MVTINQLSNGVRVVMEEIPYVRSISFGIWVKNGSKNENSDNNGISHFIEHMLFKGTQKRTAKQIAEEMDAVGGQINAYTTKEYTCYHTRVLDKHFDRAIDVMSDMFLNSKFDTADIQKECNVITEEISMYEDSPEELVHDALQEAIWKGSSLGLPILGTVESITTFTTEKLKKYFSENYHNDNTVISIAGNFKEKEILPKIEKYLGQWKSMVPYTAANTKTIYYPVLLNRKKDIEQVHLCIAFPGLERDHADKYVLTVFNTIFGGGMSSLLFQKIREENGLTYSIYSYLSAYLDAGLFTIYAGMSPNQTEKVIGLVINEIRGLLEEDKISEKLIKITKEQIISNFIIGTESTVNRMTSAGGSILLRGNIQSQEEIIENVEKVTKTDIDRLIHKIFDFSQMSISAVGKTDGIDFEGMLHSIRQYSVKNK